MVLKAKVKKVLKLKNKEIFMEKSVLKSKTVWINLILAVVSFFPGVKETVSEDVLLQVFAVLNIVLRLVTKDKVVLF